MSIESNKNFENKSLRQLESEKVLAESKQNKDILKENISQTIIKNLLSEKGYIVRSNDELGLINKITSKGNHIKFNNEGDKIWPSDKIMIINDKVFRNHNGEETIVGVVEGFKKVETTLKIEKKESKSTLDVGKNKEVRKELDGIKEETKKTNEGKSDSNNVDNEKDSHKKNHKQKKEAKIVVKTTSQNIKTVIDFQKTNQNKSILGNGPKYEAGETVVEKNDSAEFQEALLKKADNPKLKMILAISQIWIDGARKAAGEQWNLMGLSDDKKNIEKGIEGVSNELNTIINIVQDKDKNISEIDSSINSIFKQIYNVESNSENIIDDIRNIRLLFNGLNNKNYNEKLSELLKLSSGGFKDGNTQKSKEIAKNIIIQKYFPEARKKIGNIKDFDSLNSTFFQNLGIKSPILSKNIAETVKETYTTVKSATEENRNTISEQFKKSNPNFKGNSTAAIDEIIRKTASMQARTMAENGFIEYSIHTIKSNNDDIVETFKDLNSNTQATKEWLADNGLMIALSLIPMGVGFAAVGLASKGASILMKGKTLANYGNKMRIAGNSAKGVTFYEGMNLTNNALYQDNFSMDLLDGAFDSKELVRNALFFNIMGVASKLVPTGNKVISVQTMKSISAEVGAFTGVDLGVELGFEGEMSLEQFRHSLLTGGLMTIMSRGAGRINKGSRGVEFSKSDEVFYHKTNGKKYTKKADGEFYNEKGKKAHNLKKENLSKDNMKNKAENFNKLLESKISSLENGKSIKIGESTVSKNGNTYKLEYKGKSEIYSDTTAILKDIKISRKDKIEFISKNATEDFIKNINKELNLNKIEFKKEGESYYIFKKGKKIEFKKLSNGEQNTILKKIFPNAKLDNMKNLFNDTKFSNGIDRISSKLSGKTKNAFDASIKEIKEKGLSSKEFLQKLIYKGFDGGPAFTTGKLGWAISLGGMTYSSQDEFLSIWASFNNENTDILSIENAGNVAKILGELYIFKTLGLVRAVIYNEVIDKILENITEE